MNRPLLITLAFLSAFMPLSALSRPAYDVDSLEGKVEIRRAGQTRWELLKPAMSLGSNDVIRVHDGSSVRLGSQDGSTLYVRENTQMQVTLAGGESSGVLSRHTTIFFGAVFFVIKSTLPHNVVKRYDVKVFSPTAVVAVRGTSFSVEVDKETGATRTQVINGTVQIRNILQNTASFMAAPYYAVVAMKTMAIHPEPMTISNVDTLKLWVPEKEIGAQLVAQVQQSRRDRRIITGRGERVLAVIPFANNSNYGGEWPIGTALAENLAVSLGKLYPEMDAIVAGTAGEDPLGAGKRENARFVVSGAIEVFDVVQYARVSVQADAYREFNVGRVKASIQLIDVIENKVLYEGSVMGEVSGRNDPQNTWQHIGTLAFNVDKGGFASSILGQATRQALDQTNEQLQKYIHF